MSPARLAAVAAVLALAAPAAAAPGRLVLELPGAAPPDPAAGLRLAPELHARLEADLKALARFLCRDEAPFPLDDGGGARASEDEVIGFLLGFFPGFGLGHLILDDEDGFLFYLLVDFVTVATLVVVDVLFPTVWAITVLGWIGLHVLQGIDAYRTAGGGGRFRADRGPPGGVGQAPHPFAGSPGRTAAAPLVELHF